MSSCKTVDAVASQMTTENQPTALSDATPARAPKRNMPAPRRRGASTTTTATKKPNPTSTVDAGANTGGAATATPLNAIESWREHYDALLRWGASRADYNAPASCAHEGYAIGRWLNGQRNRIRSAMDHGLDDADEGGEDAGSKSGGAQREQRRLLRELVAEGKLWLESPERMAWEDVYDRVERWAKRKNGGKDWNPHHTETFEGVKIGAWMTTQRTRYKAGDKCRTPLKPDQRAKMDALVRAGKLWIERQEVWTPKYELLMRWGRENTGGAHYNAPYDCVYKGTRLGTWLNTQRQRMRGDTSKSTDMPAEHRAKLQALVDANKLWLSQPDDLWRQKYDLLLRWGEEKNGGEHYNIPQAEEYQSVRLGAWLGTQRQRLAGRMQKSRPFEPEQRKLLERLIDQGKLKPLSTRQKRQSSEEASRGGAGARRDAKRSRA